MKISLSNGKLMPFRDASVHEAVPSLPGSRVLLNLRSSCSSSGKGMEIWCGSQHPGFVHVSQLELSRVATLKGSISPPSAVYSSTAASHSAASSKSMSCIVFLYANGEPRVLSKTQERYVSAVRHLVLR